MIHKELWLSRDVFSSPRKKGHLNLSYKPLTLVGGNWVSPGSTSYFIEWSSPETSSLYIRYIPEEITNSLSPGEQIKLSKEATEFIQKAGAL